MREVTLNCNLCGKTLPIERAKEAMFETDTNKYHLLDLCPECLDKQLQQAESVNDTDGFRQKAAALISLPGKQVPAA